MKYKEPRKRIAYIVSRFPKITETFILFEIVELARNEHQQDGEVEIDDNAQLSEGNDNGCYVQAWVWVSFSGTPFDKDKEENHEQHESTEPTK